MILNFQSNETLLKVGVCDLKELIGSDALLMQASEICGM